MGVILWCALANPSCVPVTGYSKEYLGLDFWAYKLWPMSVIGCGQISNFDTLRFVEVVGLLFWDTVYVNCMDYNASGLCRGPIDHLSHFRRVSQQRSWSEATLSAINGKFSQFSVEFWQQPFAVLDHVSHRSLSDLEQCCQQDCMHTTASTSHHAHQLLSSMTCVGPTIDT